MTKRKLNRIGYLASGLTFLVASFIMAGYYFGLKGEFAQKGIVFIPLAFISNITVLIYIFFSANRNNIRGPFRSIYAMLLNIPYAVFCLGFAIYLMGFYRVTVINDTSSRITNIQLSGCDEKWIQTLAPGEKETIWMEIPHDCSIDISYLDRSRNTKGATVVGYICSGMGGPEDFHISGKNNPRY